MRLATYLRFLLLPLLFTVHLAAGQATGAKAGKPYVAREVDALLVPIVNKVNAALPFAANLTALQTSTAATVRYDNSDWIRRTGAITLDNVLYVTGGSGFYYERQIPNRRIIPQLWGAIPDDGLDDGSALLAWWNATGNFTHELPAGDYISTIDLPRNNKGNVTLRGSGVTKSRISFSGNTNGISATNDANTPGAISMEEFSVRSTGTKSGGKEAVYVQSPQAVYKHTLQNIYVESTTDGQEWGAFFHAKNTGRLDLSGLSGVSASLSVTTGILLDNTSGTPCVEIAITDARLYTVKTGISVTGLGQPAYEGLLIKGAQLVGNTNGIIGISNGYQAPHFAITDCHINTMGGGACLKLTNFVQVKITNPVLYIDKLASAPMPTAAAIFESPVDLTGSLFVNTLNNLPSAVAVTGSGGLINLDINHIKEAAGTNSFSLAASVSQITKICVENIWTGNSTWGSTQGAKFVGNTGRIDDKCVAISAKDAADGQVMRFSTTNYQWNYVAGHVGAGGPTVGISASSTINLATTNTVLIFGSSPITLTLDQTTMVPNTVLNIIRADENANAVVTVQFADQNFLIQTQNRSLQTTYTLPNVTGKFSASILFTSTHARLLNAGGIDPVSLYQTIVNVSGNITLTTADIGKRFVKAVNGDITVTVPPGLGLGFNIIYDQNGTSGTTTFTGGSISIRGASGGDGTTNKLTVAWQVGRLVAISTDWYNLERTN